MSIEVAENERMFQDVFDEILEDLPAGEQAATLTDEEVRGQIEQAKARLRERAREEGLGEQDIAEQLSDVALLVLMALGAPLAAPARSTRLAELHRKTAR